METRYICPLCGYEDHSGACGCQCPACEEGTIVEITADIAANA